MTCEEGWHCWHAAPEGLVGYRCCDCHRSRLVAGFPDAATLAPD